MQVQLDPRSIPQIPGAKIAILQAKWYRECIDPMVAKCRSLLVGAQCPDPEFHLLPGSLELPLAAQTLIRNAPVDHPYDALICFGGLMKGETYHFEMIANECSRGFGQVMLTEGIPIIMEVIPATSVQQLEARSRDDAFNKGIEAALAAAEIIAWRRSLLPNNVTTRIHIVAGFIHREICEQMIKAAHELIPELDLLIDDVTWVPGSLETPLAVQSVIQRDRPDAIVVFGVQAQGKTKHGEVIAHQVTSKLLDLQLRERMPMAVAIIGPNATLEHAEAKAKYTAQKAIRAAVHMVKLISGPNKLQN
jgi:6,7-dimethyl-8-ribityllumazine synthase